MPASCKTILFILQHAPYGDSAARETLDAALAAAAFEQDVTLLFTGEAVWQLIAGQQADAIASKDTSKMLQALDYYDIKDVFVDRQSMHERKLNNESLLTPVKVIEQDALKQLIRNADCVITL